MTTQRGLAPPGAPGARPFDPNEDIYERDSDGAAIARPRKPEPDGELPADRAEYVGPRTLPPSDAHKTFEMQTVKVRDEVRFPQKGIPTERNLPRVDATASPMIGAPLQDTPPGPPTAADATVGSFATEAGIYKSPLVTQDVPPETDENGLPINLLASASPWGASAQTGAIGPETGSLVSGSYAPTTKAPPQCDAPKLTGMAGWSRQTKVGLAVFSLGAPLGLLLLFALSPGTNGTYAAAAATQTLGPIPTPAATSVAPAAAPEPTQPASTAGAAAPPSTGGAAEPPAAAPFPTPAATVTPAAAKPSAAAATNSELSPPPAATSKPTAKGPGEAPAKPAPAVTSAPVSPPTTQTAAPQRPF